MREVFISIFKNIHTNGRAAAEKEKREREQGNVQQRF
jgi:hypothetical protein